MRRSTAPVLVLAALTACSSSEATVLDAGRTPQDAAALADGSAAPADAGSTPLDTGVDPADAGEPVDGALDAGTPADAGTATTTPTFTADIFPMFEAIGCSRVACHGSLRVQGGTVVYLPDAESAYADIFERPSIREAKLIVQPGQPLESVLYTHGRDANIPEGDLTQEDLDLIGAWITAGAPYGAEVTPAVRPQPATCSLADHPGTPPLPEACLPRCTAATWQGVVDCRSQPDVAACQGRVIAADTSTPSQIDFGPEVGALPLDCGSCLDLQTETCFVEHCAAPYLAALRCQFLDPRANACRAELTAVQACARATPELRACQAARDQLCVGP